MKDPAFLFYPADFLGGVSELTMEERGQYISLLCVQHQRGVINTTRVGLFLGCNWDELSEEVRSKFIVDKDGFASNIRLSIEVGKRAKFSEKQRNNGQKGGAPKGNSNAKKTTQKQPKNNPKTTLLEDRNINENIDSNIVEEGGMGGEGVSSDTMVVDLKKCTVSGDEWRKDFDKYKSGLRDCYNALKSDQKWLYDMQELNPRINVLLTLKKCCVNYWATKEGWQKKKTSKASEINWKTTLAKAVASKFNQVYDQ